jgi:hypothetical protein
MHRAIDTDATSQLDFMIGFHRYSDLIPMTR